MQLDKTHIVVRERNYLDLLDLGLCVMRVHFWQLLVASAVGAVPMILLNVWLLGEGLSDLSAEMGTDVFTLVWSLCLLFFLQLPLAAAPATLYLGEAMFQDQPSPRRIARHLVGSLPQLLLLVIGPRAVLVLPAVLSQEPLVVVLCSVILVCLAFLHYGLWPYLGEVILLDRNPLFRKGPGGTSTLARSINLHARNAGEQFGRSLSASILGAAWIGGLWLALDWILRMVTSNADLGPSFYTICFQAAAWIVASYFTVVRFLSYLDQRIRNEGWEIELRMRAEAARLTRALG